MSVNLSNFETTFTKVRNFLRKNLTRGVKNFTARQKLWIIFAIVTLFTTLLISNPLWRYSGEQHKEGDILHESIISPADISITNDGETEFRRAAARDSVGPIFRLESKLSEIAVQNFRAQWENLQRRADSPSGKTNAKAENFWTGAGGAEAGRVFTSRSFSANELQAVTTALRESSDGLIYDDSEAEHLQSEVALVDRKNPNQQSLESHPESNWTALSAARLKFGQRLSEIRSLSPKEREAFLKALEPLIVPSVTYDSVATENERLTAANAVAPVVVTLKRGQTVAREGDTVTREKLGQISAIRDYNIASRQWNRFFGLLAIIGALYWIAWRFIEHRSVISRLALSSENTFGLFAFVTIVQTFLMSVGFRLAEFTAVQNASAPLNDPTVWAYAIPFSFSSLTITLLADRRIALFAGLFSSLIAGLLAPKGLEFIIYAAISSAVAVYGIGRYRSRQSVTTAGLLVGAANAAATIAFISYFQRPFILNTILLSVACAALGGVIAAAVTAVFLPICESAFGILTDVKLLELSNADLPILGELALRAPGTNQHSHAVGQLAQEACRAVGANPLLARIGALYHDIGKLAAPEHYVENQLHGNPHDRLKPLQSAKIIVSHVTYGTKLGKEIGLPQRIIDFIPQHHGTRTLHYFLRKAQTLAGEGTNVEENEFRYPGPKPQFREAAIMMIADSCEAGARSLAQPTPENIRFIVTKIIDAILSDDQLNECDLTLRELTSIRESMIKSLVAIYHSRVDYPGFVPPDSGSESDEVARAKTVAEGGRRYEDPREIPISKGGEIEDEAIERSAAVNRQ